MKRVLVACEESQLVTIAFRKRGFQAYSCDLQTCSGGYDEWHLKGDVFDFIGMGWDLLIAFPPCTHLASSGAMYWPQKQKDGRQQQAIDFVDRLWNSGIKRVCIENPTGILSTVWNRPTQIIDPYLFGDPYRKRTCLWLKNLPILETRNNLFFSNENIVKPIASWCDSSSRNGMKKDGTRTKSSLPALHRDPKLRSKTFPGVSEAMAEQWSKLLID